jgi:hypothetical protein
MTDLYPKLTDLYPEMTDLYPKVTQRTQLASHQVPVLAAKLQTEDITDERISEYLHTSCTHSSSPRYPEPANKSLDQVEQLLNDFEDCRARFHSDDNPGIEWWQQQCDTLTLRLKALMGTIFRMRGLHVVTRIVDEDKINDPSGEHPWQLCFTCSCTRWIQNGFCICVQMVANWYDWGWPGANVEDVCVPLPANKKRGRPKKAASALRRQPADNDTGANNLNFANLQTRWQDNRFNHIDVGDQPQLEHAVGTAGYQKVYGPGGTCEDKASFRRSLETGKSIQVTDLKAFLVYAHMCKQVGTNPIRTGGTKPVLQRRLADDVDMDIFFGEECPGAWAPKSGTQTTREKCHVSAIVAAWSDSRLFDEFLAWGYDLPLFTWSLANHSPVCNPQPAAHSYDLENDWPRTLVDNWDEVKGTEWQQAVDKVMPRVREFAVARIVDWIHSGDWGGWAACHAASLSDCVKGLRCICGGILQVGKAPIDNGACDLCENEVLATDKEVRYCARRHKQWGNAQDHGALRVRCNVYVCKGCADVKSNGAVVAVREEGPGEYSSDEVHSASQRNNDSSSDGEGEGEGDGKVKKEANSGSQSQKDSSSDADEDEEVEAISGGGEEEVEAIVDHRRIELKNEFKVRWKGHGPEEDTWEPEASLSCDKLLQAFWEKRHVLLGTALGADPADDPKDDSSELEVGAHFVEPILLRCCIVQVVGILTRDEVMKMERR